MTGMVEVVSNQVVWVGHSFGGAIGTKSPVFFKGLRAELTVDLVPALPGNNNKAIPSLLTANYVVAHASYLNLRVENDTREGFPCLAPVLK